MGKNKKRFNWKARQVVDTEIDRSTEQKIKVDLKDGAKYDDCNALVLPSKKRKTKIKHEAQNTVKRLLTKKQRKHLEKIVERKKKKEKRTYLLEQLSKVQVSSDELNQLTSISAVQTKGLKRHWNDDVSTNFDTIDIKTESSSKKDINSIGSNKKRRRLLAVINSLDEKKRVSDPNIVGLESSSEELSSSDDEGILPQESENMEIGNNCKDVSIKEEPVAPEEQEKENEVEPSPIPQSHATEEVVNKDKTPADTGQLIGLKKERKPATFVSVDRKTEIQEARLKLPILSEEQVIMEAISENPVVILAGETGSGKTTQVPQFLYEAGYAMNGKIIGVTEPRRVAAISMSKRVGEELNLESEQVSYLIRFEGNATLNTKIKFMTDGVLLKEIQKDFLLTRYSVIILDEAHERSVYTDILMGMLSRIVPLRNKRNMPLKLIIMSATLRIEDFTGNKHLFKVPPPVIKVESRQFPVTIHFNKRTNPDYLREAYKKTCKIHTQLPEGGILIFLTGQQEVKSMVKQLRKAFPLKNKAILRQKGSDVEEGAVEDENEELTLQKVIQKVKKKKKQMEIVLPEIDLDNFESVPNDDTEGDLLAGESDSEEETWDEGCPTEMSQPLWVLPMYSLLPSYKQAMVFNPPPEGTRLCVVATNVAETSLTIPGIKYVVDCGKVKTKLYDKVTGVTAFHVVWTSKAAANQRAGRAGRVCPGHCYRLYSSAIFNDEFEEWSIPEIQRRGVDDLVLQMKALGIHRVVNFPFPSPPDIIQLRAAEKRLIHLGAVEPTPFGKDECSGKLTPLGESMAAFPVAPKFAKMLCLSHQHKLLEYTVAIVSALSVQELLLPSESCQKTIRKQWAGRGNSLRLGDVMVLLRAIGAAEYANATGNLAQFCIDNGLREKAVIEVRKLRLQLTNEINLNCPDLSLLVNPKMKPPSDLEAKLLRQILLAGLIDQVARKDDGLQEAKGKKKKALYNTPEMESSVVIHHDSCLAKEAPEWIVYQEIFETSKMFMRGITAIEPEWLPVFGSSLCSFSPPLDDPSPRFNSSTGTPYCHVNATFGRCGWTLPIVEIEFPPGIDRYRWFAVFLLDGTVCPKLKKYTKSLLSSPQTMVKTWAKLQPRTDILLKTLAAKEVDSRDKLLKCWESDASYLRSAYLKWLPESAENEVTVMWPPI